LCGLSAIAELLVYCVMQRFLLIIFWHAPLGVRSAIRRHQPPQRTVLSQIDCFIQWEFVRSQVSFDDIQSRDTGTPWWTQRRIYIT